MILACPHCGDFLTPNAPDDERWFRARHRETETGCARGDERNDPKRRRR